MKVHLKPGYYHYWFVDIETKQPLTYPSYFIRNPHVESVEDVEVPEDLLGREDIEIVVRRLR